MENNMIAKFNDSAVKNTNSPVITVWTAAGPITKKNPNYDKNACSVCGKRHGIFQKACK